MSRYGYYRGFGEYESKGQKLAKSKKKIAALKKKNPDIEPICIEGRLLSKTWWGKAWNANLEKYSDLSNRLDRGRSYVRNGSILDLQIKTGYVSAQIMGSGSSIYKCRLDITPLSKSNWEKIKQQCSGNINSISELLSGKFPEEMKTLFTVKDAGLFPASNEIEKSCDCPDYASLCKHLAATLYGIGARFDHKPELIFTLRGVDPGELINSLIKIHKDNLIDKALKANKKRQLSLADDELSTLFKIDFEGLDNNYKKKLKDESSPDTSWKNTIQNDLDKQIPKVELINLLNLSSQNARILTKLLIPVAKISLQELLDKILIEGRDDFYCGGSALLSLKSVGRIRCRDFINELLCADLGGDFIDKLKLRKDILCH